jgi:hypothetical protein
MTEELRGTLPEGGSGSMVDLAGRCVNRLSLLQALQNQAAT